MKIDTILPFVKWGVGLLALALGATGTAVAYKNQTKLETITNACPVCQSVTVKCITPPIKGELVFKR